MFHAFYNPVNEEMFNDWSGMANQGTSTNWVLGSVMVMMVCDMGYIYRNIIHPFFLLRLRGKSTLLFFVDGSQQEESCWGRGWWGWHIKNLLRDSWVKDFVWTVHFWQDSRKFSVDPLPIEWWNLFVYLFIYF